MFECDPKIDVMVRSLNNAVARMSRGEMLTHEAIRELTGHSPYEGSLPQALRRFRRDLLEERGLLLRAEPGIGFRLATTREQVKDEPERRCKFARRQIRRGIKAVASLKAKKLTDFEMRMRSFNIGRLEKSERDLVSARMQQAIFAKKSATHRRPSAS